MEFLDRQTFEDCMRQVFIRLDRQQELITSIQEERNGKPPAGGIAEDDTLDNQDVCMMLRVSKRTLQRYRSEGLLPYRMHRHKTYYRKADVELFISTHMKEILRDSRQEKTSGMKRNTGKNKVNHKRK